MTVNEILRDLQEKQNVSAKIGKESDGSNPLSLKKFFQFLEDSGITVKPPSDQDTKNKHAGIPQAARIERLWGERITLLFNDRFRTLKNTQGESSTNGKAPREESKKLYWNAFYSATESALKNAKWLRRILQEEAAKDPNMIMDDLSGNLRNNLSISCELDDTLKKIAVYGFLCLSAWHFGRKEQKQHVLVNQTYLRKNINDLAENHSEYIHATNVMLAADPVRLLSRCVFAVSAQCWEENEQCRLDLLEKCWLPDDCSMLKMASESTEAACHAARYFYERGNTQATLEAVKIALRPKADLTASYLLLEDSLISVVYREGDSQTWELFRQRVTELAEMDDAYANCLIGQALYCHWQDDFSENQWLKGFLPENDVQLPENAARKHFERGLQQSVKNQKIQAQCLFYLGKIYEETGDDRQAQNCYEKAMVFKGEDNPWAEKAEKAKRNAELIARAHSVAKSKVVDTLPIEGVSNYVFLMGISKPYQEFIKTLPTVNGGWSIVLPNTPAPPYPSYYSYMPCSAGNQLYTFHKDLNRAVSRLLESQGKVPQMLFAFFNENQEVNVQQVTTLLVNLSERLEKVRKNSYGKQDTSFYNVLSEIRVYVSVENDYYANLLDSMQQMLYDQYRFYIPLNIVNPYTHAVQKLFTEYPLFTPLLKERRSDRALNLVVLGTGKCAMTVVQEAMALPISDHQLVIHVVGEDAEHAKQRFLQKCPAIGSEPWMQTFVEVRFYRCPLEELPLYSFGDADELASALSQGDYFVVAADQDSDNVELSLRLRESILSRSGNKFSNEPIIAAQCTDSMGALLMEHMRAQSNGSGKKWYVGYHILKFGTSDVFSWNELENGLIETRAKAIHLSYCGADPTDTKALYWGLKGYYLRYYNRSSSRSTAVRWGYCAFDSGKNLDQKQYRGPQGKIADEGLEQAARLEHIRWCLQLASCGWRTATEEQVKAYIAGGNPSHQLHIAKLHPYLVPWERLDDVYDFVNSQWLQFHSDKLKNPKETTKENILASSALV